MINIYCEVRTRPQILCDLMEN